MDGSLSPTLGENRLGEEAIVQIPVFKKLLETLQSVMSYPWGQPDQPFVAETTHLSPQFPTHIEGTPAFAGGIFVPDAFNLPAPAVTWDPSYVAHGLHPSMPQPMLPTSALGGAGGFIPSAPMFQSAHDAYPQQFVAVQGCSSVDEEERRKEARRETQRRYFRRKKVCTLLSTTPKF